MVPAMVFGHISWLLDGIIHVWPALLLVSFAFALQSWLKNLKMDTWLLEHYQRISGIIVFAGYFFWLKVRYPNEIASLFYAQFPLNFRDILTLIAGSLALGLAIFKLGGKASASRPQVKYSKLTIARLVSFVMVWIIYLLLYEFYFRGILLFKAFMDAPVAGVVAIYFICRCAYCQKLPAGFAICSIRFAIGGNDLLYGTCLVCPAHSLGPCTRV